MCSSDLALITCFLGPELRIAAGALLAVVAAGAALVERPGPGAPTLELAGVRRALDLAGRAEPDTAVVLAAGSAADGQGIEAVLDWWALDRSQVAVDVLGAPRATLALARAGWRARTLTSDGAP